MSLTQFQKKPNVNSRIYLGLVTYPESKYLNQVGVHEDFDSLSKALKINNNFIYNRNVTDKKSEYFTFLNEISSIYILANTLIKSQLNLLQKSYFRNFYYFFRHLSSAFYILSRMLMWLFLSYLSRKHKINYQIMKARQHNITEAHLFHLKNFIDSDYEYALIVEDDFKINEIYDPEDTIIKVLEYIDSNPYIQVFSISESFNYKKLGLEFICEKSSFKNLQIFDQLLPITNTVSAVIYKKLFLTKIYDSLLTLRKHKIIPIDHKLNIVLNDLINKSFYEPKVLSFLSPGLFIQRSLHD